MDFGKMPALMNHPYLYWLGVGLLILIGVVGAYFFLSGVLVKIKASNRGQKVPKVRGWLIGLFVCLIAGFGCFSLTQYMKTVAFNYVETKVEKPINQAQKTTEHLKYIRSIVISKNKGATNSSNSIMYHPEGNLWFGQYDNNFNDIYKVKYRDNAGDMVKVHAKLAVAHNNRTRIVYVQRGKYRLNSVLYLPLHQYKHVMHKLTK